MVDGEEENIKVYYEYLYVYLICYFVEKEQILFDYMLISYQIILFFKFKLFCNMFKFVFFLKQNKSVFESLERRFNKWCILNIRRIKVYDGVIYCEWFICQK